MFALHSGVPVLVRMQSQVSVDLCLQTILANRRARRFISAERNLYNDGCLVSLHGDTLHLHVSPTLVLWRFSYFLRLNVVATLW